MADLFDTAWIPQDYLQQYYAIDFMPADEDALCRYILTYLREAGRHFPRAIEVGCGPTLLHVPPFVPYVGAMHLADYIPENLAEVGKWLEDCPGAHNWDLFIRHSLECEAVGSGTPEGIEARKRLMREKITTLKRVDLRQTAPLGDSTEYDLVGSFFCADSATDSKAEWRQMMENLFHLVTPGGMVFVAALRNACSYAVLDRHFPSAQVSEGDMVSVFAASDFDPSSIDITVVASPDFLSEGYDSIIIARGMRRTG